MVLGIKCPENMSKRKTPITKSNDENSKVPRPMYLAQK
jgi:hypothetical protein